MVVLRGMEELPTDDTGLVSLDSISTIDESQEMLQENGERVADHLRMRIREKIKELQRRRRPLNILLVGPPGVGKSSLIVSAVTATKNKWGSYVMAGGMGHSGTSYQTAYLRRLNLMNPQEEDPMYKSKDEEDPDAKLHDHSPRFFDVCGMPDEDTPAVRAVLRRLLYGGIPLETPLGKVLGEAGTEDGPNFITNKYWATDKNLAIDRVIFVMSSTEDFPEQLAQAVVKVARPKGTPDSEDGIEYKRAVPIFAYITKMDKKSNMTAEDLKQFDKRKTAFIEALGMKGETWRLGQGTNYFTDDENPLPLRQRFNDPGKDIPMLDFLEYLLEPNLRVDHELDIPVRPGHTRTTYAMSIMQQKVKRYGKAAILIIFVLLVLLGRFYPSDIISVITLILLTIVLFSMYEN